MVFKISRVKGHPNYESLPVAKIVDYPLEKRDYKPFAQARVCVNEESLIFQLWAFEVTPNPKSSIKAVFHFPAPRGVAELAVETFADKTTTLHLAGQAVERAEYQVHNFTGEDLQGIYWGVTVTVPQHLILAHCPDFVFEKGQKLRGNFYKLCEQSPEHYGSFFPADFTGDGCFAEPNFGDFEIVNY